LCFSFRRHGFSLHDEVNHIVRRLITRGVLVLRLQRFESPDLKPNRCIAPQAPTMSYPHPDGRPGTPVPIRRASSSGSARLCLPETAERRGTGPAAIVGHASFSVTYSSSGEVRQREAVGMGWRLGFRLLSPPARGRRERLGFFRASEASGATIFSRNVDLFVLRELITNWYYALLSFKVSGTAPRVPLNKWGNPA
jgi:hypothetical protein